MTCKWSIYSLIHTLYIVIPKYVGTGVGSGIGLIDYWIEDCILYLQCHTMEMEVLQMMARLLAEIRTEKKWTLTKQKWTPTKKCWLK
jgi:hypothetical protein